MKTLILTDIHGCYDEMLELIGKAKADKVYICGDLIDRGPESIKVVDYVISNNISCLLGNHELMFIEAIQPYLEGNCDKLDLKFSNWWLNGGEKVFNQYTTKSQLTKHLEFFKSLPIYRLLDETHLDKQILLSHSMISQYVEEIEEPIGPSYLDIGNHVVPFVWNRDKKPNKSSKYFNIFGHSPTDYYANLDKQPYVTEWVANIDTGCAYKDTPERGALTGLILPTMEIIQTRKQ